MRNSSTYNMLKYYNYKLTIVSYCGR